MLDNYRIESNDNQKGIIYLFNIFVRIVFLLADKTTSSCADKVRCVLERIRELLGRLNGKGIDAAINAGIEYTMAKSRGEEKSIDTFCKKLHEVYWPCSADYLYKESGNEK